MARGDECKHVTAVATYLSSSSPKKVEMASVPPKPSSSPKAQEKPKDYGSWGPVFKNKQNFVNMHLC